jgi:L-amino acid N-acyltransferase
MKLDIRPATANDLPEILDIINYEIATSTAIYEYEPRTLETQTQWFEDKLAKGFPILVCAVGTKLAGFGSYGTFRERAAYARTVEHSVYVAQDFQGCGIGSAMLNELIVKAKNDGIHTMIGGIDAANILSIEFHKKHGFAEAGRIREAGFKFDRWLDLVFMQLML